MGYVMLGRKFSVMLVAAAIATACAPLPPQRLDTGTNAPTGDLRVSRVLVGEGLTKLREQHYEDASRIFNAGLKFDPENAQIHFLNGLTYHLLYLRGDHAARDLAATGYEMALSIEPAHYRAALQLGRLDYESKRYDKSVEAFRRAVDIEPTSGDAYLGLAMAAYYAHDLVTARTAVEKSVVLLKGVSMAARVEAMVYASLGQHNLAKKASADYTTLEPDADASRQIKRRVDQWGAWYAALPAVGVDDAARPRQTSVQLAQATRVTPEPPAPAPAPSKVMPSAGAQPATSNEPAQPRWFGCDKDSADASASTVSASSGTGNSGSSGSADETLALPALPVPCKGAGNPRMVILDVAIVRTEDTVSSSNGINLLNGLAYVLGRSRQVVDVLTSTSGASNTRTITTTTQRNDSLSNPDAPQGGLAYSLNIANAADTRSEVLAQPSLVALDRQPSTFFSGRNITLGIAGQSGGASTFTDKPVGVSLSVTPTFSDDDTMLVAVRAARSFVEQVDANVSFGQSMQTSRNSVTANVVLKFGQTLILSGLAEQEVQHASTGVPVLQDIPALQYLFRNKTTQNFTRSVLVLITPRKPELEHDQLARTLAQRTPGADINKEDLARKLSDRLRETESLPANLNRAYQHALESKLFLQFRAGDMSSDQWAAPSRLDNMLRQFGKMLYF